jgi:hypothetical protein
MSVALRRLALLALAVLTLTGAFGGAASADDTRVDAAAEQHKAETILTRSSMAVLFYGQAGVEFSPPAAPTYPDVLPSHPAYTAIEWATHAGIVAGYADGTYRPDQTVTRMAAAAHFYRAAGMPVFNEPDVPSFTDVPTSHPFFFEIEWSVKQGIFSGYPDGTFRPTLPADV